MTPVPTWVDIRRSGALVLALTMMLLLLAVPATAQQNVESAPVEGLCLSGAVVLQYDDAAEISQVHRAAVDCLTDMEVVHGRTAPDGEGQVYRPDEPVERDQMASFIIRGLEAAGYELPPGDATFDDVTDANVHADTIRTLAAIEVTTGVTADRYAPDEPVTRAQMATFLLRALAFAEELSIEAVTVDEPACDDTEGLFHQPFIAGAEQQGIVEGVTDDRYEPRNGSAVSRWPRSWRDCSTPSSTSFPGAARTPRPATSSTSPTGGRPTRATWSPTAPCSTPRRSS